MKASSLAVLAGAVALGLAGCATPPKDPSALAAFKALHDPLEPLNRRVFAFNQQVDRFLIKPIAEGYLHVVPPPGRDGIRNFVQNLGEPLVFLNSVLQGDLKRSGNAAARFAINTTAGIAGVFDVAAKNGLRYQIGDFGQTLYVWGFKAGPYLVLPVVGPSDPRDAIGSGIDLYLDPFRYVAERYNYPTGISVAKAAIAGIDQRARSIGTLDELKRESVDYYASFRSLYRQHRAAEVRNGHIAPAPTPPPNLYSDPDAVAPTGP
ncbi:MAG: MlaA family lipoprotein [Opitutaceae bacterium]